MYYAALCFPTYLVGGSERVRGIMLISDGKLFRLTGDWCGACSFGVRLASQPAGVPSFIHLFVHSCMHSFVPAWTVCLSVCLSCSCGLVGRLISQLVWLVSWADLLVL